MTRISLAVITAAALSGCWFDGYGTPSDDGASTTLTGEAMPAFFDEGAWDESPLDVDRTTLTGSVGRVRDFSGETWRASGGYATSASWLDLRARTESGVAMVRFDVWGDLSQLEVGRTHTFTDDLFGEMEWRGGSPSDAVALTAINCSGPSDDDWEYDVPADEIVVDVQPGAVEGELDMHFTVRLGGDPEIWTGPGSAPTGDVVHGTVTYSVPVI